MTARIRLAFSLVQSGHEVSLICNTDRSHRYRGVAFLPLLEADSIEADVLILASSGGNLNLRPILSYRVDVRLRCLWLAGLAPLTGVHDFRPDLVVHPSNFLKRSLSQSWLSGPWRHLVCYNGYGSLPFRSRLMGWLPRDPFRLCYTSHPSKGFEACLQILRRLRSNDSRFTLHVFGGNELWGGEPQSILHDEPGLVYHGMVGQRRLLSELRRSTYHLNVQECPEAFGLSLLEAMASGNVVIASPVGAYIELVQNGTNGFLLSGSHLEPSTWDEAAALILYLHQNRLYSDFVRRRAQAVPWTWARVAAVWTYFLNRELNSNTTAAAFRIGPPCGCGGTWLPAPDGLHCDSCGEYRWQL